MAAEKEQKIPSIVVAIEPEFPMCPKCNGHLHLDDAQYMIFEGKKTLVCVDCYFGEFGKEIDEHGFGLPISPFGHHA